MPQLSSRQDLCAWSHAPQGPARNYDSAVWREGWRGWHQEKREGKEGRKKKRRRKTLEHPRLCHQLAELETGRQRLGSAYITSALGMGKPHRSSFQP